jgi:hypothetical protein
MATLRMSNAESAIVHEWDQWADDMAEKYGTSADISFFLHLERDRPELLDFNCSGDKLRAVQLLLSGADRI